MENLLRERQRQGAGEHSCHTSIRPTLGKPGKCKWWCCGCACVIRCDFLAVLVSVFVWEVQRQTHGGFFLFVACTCLCVVACQAVHLYHWPFIHLTVHLPTCLAGCLFVRLIIRCLNNFDGPFTDQTDQFTALY